MPFPPAQWSSRRGHAVRTALPVSVQPFFPPLFRVSYHIWAVPVLAIFRCMAGLPWEALSIILGVNPVIGGDFLLLGEANHLHPRRIPGRPACATFERGLQLPDRRVARPADGFQRKAGTCFAALAFDLQPTIAGVEALRDRGRRLRRPAIALHL